MEIKRGQLVILNGKQTLMKYGGRKLHHYSDLFGEKNVVLLYAEKNNGISKFLATENQMSVVFFCNKNNQV